MGNLVSSTSNKSQEKEFQHFYNVIDYIATYYILTMDFKSLSKLSEKEYCNNLVVLTSDIIERYFNDIEITYLEQRVKEGKEVNELTKENVTFLNKDQLQNLDVSNDEKKTIRKKRVCIGIAKFYVKIAHIFAAIVMTINPVYSYKDLEGNIVKTGLMEKDKIPKNVQRNIYRLNICDNRINALKRGETIDESSENVSIHPKVCNMNINKKTGEVKTLADEPGINELMQLYLDDKYDYSNGSFTGMSESTQQDFMRDLKTFYTAFTGNQTMPPEITKFSDIKLRDYKSQKGCMAPTYELDKVYTLNKNDDLFEAYAKNIRKMIQRATDNQNKLLSVINTLFTFVADPYSQKKRIRVNPKLTEKMLQQAVEKTRKYITELYVTCEMDYVNGIKLYQAIVEKKILESTQNQIETLKKKQAELISETKTILQTNKNNKPSETVSVSNASDVPVNNVPVNNVPINNVPINNVPVNNVINEPQKPVVIV